MRGPPDEARLLADDRQITKKAGPLINGPAFFNLIPAVTYVPTQLPVQYHRPGEA